MFFLARPNDSDISEFLARQRTSAFSYDNPGLTRNPPRGYFTDRQAFPVGKGPHDFAAARAALFAWRMFPPWTQVYSGGQNARNGLSVAVAVRHLGFWSLNGTRVVYEVDETNQAGFAYGTLEDHGETGEELFYVTMDAVGVVRYELLAVSRPGHLLSWLGLPYVRRLQARFRRDSARSLQSALIQV